MGSYSAAMIQLRGKELCHYCKTRPSETLDHIIPKFYGGSEGNWNIVPSCSPCNHAKSHEWPSCECDRCQNAIRIFLKSPGRVEYARGRMESWNEQNQQNVVYHRDVLIPKLAAKAEESSQALAAFYDLLEDIKTP